VLHTKATENATLHKRLATEFRAATELEHPNIVRALEIGSEGTTSYLVYELVEGENLGDRIERKGKLSEAESVRIITQIAQALHYAHLRNVIHRDVKPDNILVLPDGRAKLTDFGLAKDYNNDQDLTRHAAGLGTPHFMAPEQFSQAKTVDPRADIYSLGATLYHLVMGELPFTGGDSMEVMAKQVMEALNSGNMKNVGVSKHMNYFIERMMSKDKDLRYSTPRELVDDITEQIDGFKSLEYKPDDSQQSSVSKIMQTGPLPRVRDARPTTRRIKFTAPPPSSSRPPGTNTTRFSKIEELKAKYRKK
jgi:serine/threonine protein kinase